MSYLTPNFNSYFSYLCENVINESVTFFIDDDKSTPTDLFSLGSTLNSLSMLDNVIQKNTSPEEYQNWMKDRSRYYDIITLDGGIDTYAKEGIINFYVFSLPEKAQLKVVELIKYYLEEYNAELTGEIYKNNSQVYQSQVYRFPVQIADKKFANSPEINLSNQNARVILYDVLQYPNVCDEDGCDLVGRLNARDLLMRIEMVEDDDDKLQSSVRNTQQDNNIFRFGLSLSRIKDILSRLKEIAQYAIDEQETYIYYN